MSILVYSTARGSAVTDTRRVAKAFGKKHGNVLQALDNLEINREFDRLNFHSITYLDARNRKQRAVMMTRAGFTFLVLSFRGKRVAQFKQDYIAQFDRMDAKLQASQTTAAMPPLVDFTRHDVQVERAKGAAAQLIRLDNSPHDVIQHHSTVMKYLTARTPSQYVRDAVARGLRVASLSGRQVLRRLEPAKAATAAFMDQQVEQGRTLEQLAAAGIPQALPAAFEAILRCGITPAELSNSQ